jgi:hypothetical protein
MSEEKIREVIDKINRGEIPLGSAEVETKMTDEGRVSSTTRRRCGPCTIGNHSECEGSHMCDCDHTFHQRETQE